MALSDLVPDKNDILAKTEGIEELSDLRDAVISATEVSEKAYSIYNNLEHDCNEKAKYLASTYSEDCIYDNSTDLQVCTDTENSSLKENGYHCVYTTSYNPLSAGKSCFADANLEDTLAIAKALNNCVPLLNDGVKQAEQEVLDSYSEKKKAYLSDKAEYRELCKQRDEAHIKANKAGKAQEDAEWALADAFREHTVSGNKPSCATPDNQSSCTTPDNQSSSATPEYVDYLRHIDEDGYSWADFAEKYREQLKGFTFSYNSNTTHGVLDTLAKTKSEPSSRQLFVLRKLKDDILNGTVKQGTEDDSTSQAEPKQTSIERHPDWIVLSDMMLYLCKSVIPNGELDAKICRSVSYQGNMSEKQSKHVTGYLGEIVNEIFKAIDPSTEYETEDKNGLLAIKGVCNETQFDSWFKNYLDTNSDWVSKINANADLTVKLDISKFSQLVN